MHCVYPFAVAVRVRCSARSPTAGQDAGRVPSAQVAVGDPALPMPRQVDRQGEGGRARIATVIQIDALAEAVGIRRRGQASVGAEAGDENGTNTLSFASCDHLGPVQALRADLGEWSGRGLVGLACWISVSTFCADLRRGTQKGSRPPPGALLAYGKGPSP